MTVGDTLENLGLCSLGDGVSIVSAHAHANIWNITNVSHE